MKIYTSVGCGDGKINNANKYDVGHMITPLTLPQRKENGISYCLDNGAYSAFKRGLPFNKISFLRALDYLHDKGFSLDFIVIPDIVCGGFRSMRFSHAFQLEHFSGGGRLAFSIQDGMKFENVIAFGLEEYTHLFIGGSVDWKWKNAEDWIKFGHDQGKKVHIGRCGQLKYLEAAERWGADSVDSSSFNRNDSWHIIEEFYKKGQKTFIKEE